MNKFLIFVLLACPILSASDCGEYSPPPVHQDAGNSPRVTPPPRHCESDDDCEPNEWCSTYRGKDAICVCEESCE